VVATASSAPFLLRAADPAVLLIRPRPVFSKPQFTGYILKRYQRRPDSGSGHQSRSPSRYFLPGLLHRGIDFLKLRAERVGDGPNLRHGTAEFRRP